MILLILMKNKDTDIDTFYNQKNYNNDGNMTFDFLSNKNTTNVLEKYYLDDDIKINGDRLNYHIYQTKTANNGSPSYMYGIPEFYKQGKAGNWNRFDTFGDKIFSNYGVRR